MGRCMDGRTDRQENGWHEKENFDFLIDCDNVSCMKSGGLIKQHPPY